VCLTTNGLWWDVEILVNTSSSVTPCCTAATARGTKRHLVACLPRRSPITPVYRNIIIFKIHITQVSRKYYKNNRCLSIVYSYYLNSYCDWRKEYWEYVDIFWCLMSCVVWNVVDNPFRCPRMNRRCTADHRLRSTCWFSRSRADRCARRFSRKYPALGVSLR